MEKGTIEEKFLFFFLILRTHLTKRIRLSVRESMDLVVCFGCLFVFFFLQDGSMENMANMLLRRAERWAAQTSRASTPIL